MYQKRKFLWEKSIFFIFYLLTSDCTATEDAKCLARLDVLSFLVVAVDHIYIYI